MAEYIINRFILILVLSFFVMAQNLCFTSVGFAEGISYPFPFGVHKVTPKIDTETEPDKPQAVMERVKPSPVRQVVIKKDQPAEYNAAITVNNKTQTVKPNNTASQKVNTQKQAFYPAKKYQSSGISYKKPVAKREYYTSSVKQTNAVSAKPQIEKTITEHIPLETVESKTPDATNTQEPYNEDKYMENVSKSLDVLNQKTPAAPPEKPIDSAGSLLKMIFSVIVVVSLIFITAIGYKKLAGVNTSLSFTGKLGLGKGKEKLNVISTTPLGQGKDLHVVEINGKQLVVGSTNNNINLLTEIKPEDVETIKEKAASQGEEFDIFDPDNYEAGYSELYKEYLANNPFPNSNDEDKK